MHRPQHITSKSPTYNIHLQDYASHDDVLAEIKKLLVNLTSIFSSNILLQQNSYNTINS